MSGTVNGIQCKMPLVFLDGVRFLRIVRWVFSVFFRRDKFANLIAFVFVSICHFAISMFCHFFEGVSKDLQGPHVIHHFGGF